MITISDIPNGIYKDWLLQVGEYLRTEWGLNGDFGLKIALLILFSFFASNSARLVSGFRDPERQKELQRLWDAGIREGIVVRPATNSRHSYELWGAPDSHAIDIVFSNPELAGQYAPFFGLLWGGNFNNRDLPHFYIK